MYVDCLVVRRAHEAMRLAADENAPPSTKPTVQQAAALLRGRSALQ
ncbi:hypothetical protein ACWCQ0_05005 [Streptomyces massasporeus]|uniref:Uncharacterized protein n=1 Tax=Streptomyces massasporeus TaxID=67324 RepID=A0ABW6LB95_9ACTN